MTKIINTDRELHGLKPLAARYERAVSKARGLSVLVYPSGLKSFVVRYVSDGGERRRLPIGDYPGLSLAEARLKAQGLRIEIVAGADPAAARATARAAARMGETFEELAAAYFKAAAIGLHGGRRRPLRPQTIERQKLLWRRRLQPVIGARRYGEFRRADVRRFMEGLVTESTLSPSSIASIGDVLRAVFAYALHNDLVEANPTAGLTRPITPESRTRRFSAEALGALLGALMDASGAAAGRADPHARMAPHMALGLRFLILTLTRRTEAAGARWSEIDFAARTWTIPGVRTKNRQAHVVPLSPQALAVLREARKLANASDGGFIFPSPKDPQAHLDSHALTRAVNRLCARLELPTGSPHDFRRTGATVLTSEACGVRRFIVGKVLGHTSHEGAAVTAVYDRNDYLAEKRQALELWGATLRVLFRTSVLGTNNCGSRTCGWYPPDHRLLLSRPPPVVRAFAKRAPCHMAMPVGDIGRARRVVLDSHGRGPRAIHFAFGARPSSDRSRRTAAAPRASPRIVAGPPAARAAAVGAVSHQ